jgi:cytochrome c
MIHFAKTIPWPAVVMVAMLFAWMGTHDAHASADLTRKYNCVACHAEASKKVGPSYKDIAAKYAGKPDAEDRLAKKIRSGGAGVWGPMPMPPHPQVPEADARAMATYVLGVK